MIIDFTISMDFLSEFLRKNHQILTELMNAYKISFILQCHITNILFT